MYKRKIEEILKKWKANSNRFPLVDAIKLGDYNIGHTGQFVTLPIYMAFMLNG